MATGAPKLGAAEPRPPRSTNGAPPRSATPFRLELGATVVADGVRFRVWAPKRSRVDVVVESPTPATVSLDALDGGWFVGVAAGVRAGARYRYRLDDAGVFPDPCSRYQPDGPHGASMVVDPFAHAWRDGAWPGVRLAGGQVVYEMHVGTFTPAGTLDAAAAELPELARLGVTLVEIMPVAEAPGRWNWGYDGVALFAPSHNYGDPDALRRFVDAAHASGLGVLLDVVYNHLGPAGNCLPAFSDAWFTDRYENEWGDAINFDGPDAAPVRDFFVRNAGYWIAEFHLDGLRLDATQSMHDASPVHVLAEIAAAARAAAGARDVVLIGENEPQDVRCLRPIADGGYGLDALWNDDFHHSSRVAVTGRREAYYTDYRGTAQELVACLRHGFLYQGQHYRWQDKRRGSASLRESARALVLYTQNHDQVANGLRGERLHQLASPALVRAITALQLLAPGTAMLFMGQEFWASSPFCYFADHCAGDLGRAVTTGRRAFLGQFPSFAGSEAQAAIPDPCAEATFRRSVLDLGERRTHASAYRLHEDLLRIRRDDAVVRNADRDGIDAAVLGERTLVLRWFGDAGGDRLLVVNLGPEVELEVVPEPLLAPPPRATWRLVWSSEAVVYGGLGVAAPQPDRPHRLPATSAQLYTADGARR